MLTGSTLVVVADGAIARFLSRAQPGARLLELVDSNMRGGHAATQWDRPARTHDRPGIGLQVIDPWPKPHDETEEQFLREVAARALEILRSGGVGQLVLCAPPRALGALRAALSPEAREKLTLSWSRDITRETPAEIDARLKDLRA